MHIFLNRQPFETKERVECERPFDNVLRHSRWTKNLLTKNPGGAIEILNAEDGGFLLDHSSPFMEKLWSYRGALENVFGKQNLWEKKGKPTYISKLIQRARQSAAERNFIERDFDLVKLRFLTENAKAVKSYNRRAFYDLKKDLVSAGGNERCQFSGPRYELFIASLLIAKKVEFEKPRGQDRDKGDFIISTDGTPLTLEATSVCISDGENNLPGSQDFRYKIEQAIRRKGEKLKYAYPANALFIDVSNIQFHSAPFHKPGIHSADYLAFSSQKKNQGWIPKAAQDAGFGSVILTQYIVVDNDPFYEPEFDFLYTRFDSPCIKPNLKRFLDKHFPPLSLWRLSRDNVDTKALEEKIFGDEPRVSAHLFPDEHFFIASDA